MSNPIDLSTITDQDIENLFSDIETAHNEGTGIDLSSSDVNPGMVKPIMADPFAKSDFERYWKDQGVCQNCKDGSVPQCLNGVFICTKCNWRL